MKLVDFSRFGQAEQVWQNLQIPDNWGHYNRPSGHRFLGSLRLSKQNSNYLLDITSENLGRLGSLTFTRLYDRFDSCDPKEYWIRIITLALSEYAYYDEGDHGFWPSICDRLKIENTQGTQNALRKVLDRGFNLLGLIKAQKKTFYVSTLWLQSGIPQQNLTQFAQLLEELSSQYDWRDIAREDPEDLSWLLLDSCRCHHRQWTKLLTFLGSSCGEEECAEPISGNLIQGLAIVAQTLEKQGLEPTVLQDAHKREKLLQDFGLPQTFFLRDWDDLVQVLTPQHKNSVHRHMITSRRKKPLLLKLDVFDSQEIQLFLPAQVLWNSAWEGFSDNYIKIPEQGWDSMLSSGGRLEILEPISLSVKQIVNEWIWHLRLHTNASLMEWQCEGISPDFPVLFFDAETGDRLMPPDGLKGHSEIICFHNRAIRLEVSNGIEIAESFVPCDISGWRGEKLELTCKQAQITIHGASHTQSLRWDSCPLEFPQIRGLKLKCKSSTYLEVPSIWHPPVSFPKALSIQVESIRKRAMDAN
jgi:hypothetical protein